MSRSGTIALKKIIISYSPAHHNPSVRQFFATHLPLFKQKYPSVTIDIRPRFWPERAITGVYQDGSERVYNVNQLSSMGIWIRCHKLVNSANDFDLPFNNNHVHLHRKSVQGVWNPWLWNSEVRHKERAEPAKWDRKLSSQEWDYYVDRYSTQMRLEGTAVQRAVAKKTAIVKQQTEEVRRRWLEHVTPRMQTDLEHNMDSFKADYKKTGAKMPPVQMEEYKLFAVPQLNELGQDAVNAMRKNEQKQLEQWWAKRKEQLKAPE